MPRMDTPTLDRSAHSPEELRDTLRRPHHLLGLVLVQRERFFGSVARDRHLWWLVGTLALGSIAYAVPFGLVVGGAQFWKVPALLLGAVVICVPSLHVVGAFIGSRFSLPQTLSLALVISAVSALFSFGFFPIAWFLGATMRDEGLVTPGGIALTLLGIAVIAGITQALRTHHAVSVLREFRAHFTPLLVAWSLLLVFITWRLAGALGLVG